jgi:hypothetical protein
MGTNGTQISTAERTRLLNESLPAVVLAQDAYNTDDTKPPAGWRVVASTAKPQPDINGFFARVYERIGPVLPGEARYAVAFRGTNGIGDLKDLDADLDIAFRRLPGQYRQALAFIRNVCEKNNINPEEMMLTGHSLGGYLAVAVGTALGAHKMWAFNSPGPTQRIRNRLASEIPCISKPPGNNLVQVRSVDDLISKWQYDQGIIIGVKTAGDSHSLDNLRQGIIDEIAGRPPQPAVPVKKFSLARVFNAVSGVLARSKLAGAVIKRLMDNAPRFRRPPKPPACELKVCELNPSVTPQKNDAALLSRAARRARHKPS